MIVLVSGGFDSAALLYKLLKETSHELHVHHIEINYTNTLRYLAEAQALTNILKWCRKNFPKRPFSYSESTISFDEGDCPEHFIWALHGGMLIRAGFGDTMCTGRIATDNSPPGALNQERAESVFKIVTGDTNAKWELPLLHLCKRDLIKSTPKELFELTWSCRNPIIHKGKYKCCYDCLGCIKRIEGMWQSGLYERDEQLYEKFSDSLDKQCPTIKIMSRDKIKRIEVDKNKLPPLPSEITAAVYDFTVKEYE